jgi:hypothetical protein
MKDAFEMNGEVQRGFAIDGDVSDALYFSLEGRVTSSAGGLFSSAYVIL